MVISKIFFFLKNFWVFFFLKAPFGGGNYEKNFFNFQKRVFSLSKKGKKEKGPYFLRFFKFLGGPTHKFLKKKPCGFSFFGIFWGRINWVFFFLGNLGKTGLFLKKGEDLGFFSKNPLKIFTHGINFSQKIFQQISQRFGHKGRVIRDLNILQTKGKIKKIFKKTLGGRFGGGGEIKFQPP